MIAAAKNKPAPRRHLDALIKRARIDPWAFNQLLLGMLLNDKAPHELHDRILDFVVCCCNARRSCVVQAPPEHGKSTQIIPYLAWRIGQTPSLKIGVVSRDTDLSAEHLMKLRKMLTHPVYRSVFPDIAPDYQRSINKGEWSKEKLFLKDESEPCLERFSLLGASEGHRLDMIFADDCVTRDCLYSEAARRITTSALFDTFTDRLTDQGIMIVSNNCWHKQDAIHRMRNSDAYSTLWAGYDGTQRLGIKISYPPAGWRWGVEEYFSLWSQWPKRRLLDRRKKDKRSYIRAFEARAVQAEECRFPPMDKWARYDKPEKGGQLYAFLDPSGGRDAKKGDYAALVVLQRCVDQTINVIGCMVGRFSVKDQIDSIFNTHNKYLENGMGGLHKVKVEMLPKEERWILLPFNARRDELKKQRKQKWRVPFSVKHPTENKNSRIERLGPLFDNGWLRFPKNLEQLIVKDTLEGNSWRLLVEMTEEWPFGDHDDPPDALAGAAAEIEKDNTTMGAFVVNV